MPFRSLSMRFASAIAILIFLSPPIKSAPKAKFDDALEGAISQQRRGADLAGAIVNVALQSPVMSASSFTARSGKTAVAVFNRPSESVKPVFERSIPHLPDKKLIAVVVNYPPGAKSRPHHHAKSAFIYAFVLSGEIRSAVGAEPARIYRAGESFYEDPEAHHLVSENASDTNAASLLAVFVVGTDDKPLTAPDAETVK